MRHYRHFTWSSELCHFVSLTCRFCLTHTGSHVGLQTFSNLMGAIQKVASCLFMSVATPSLTSTLTLCVYSHLIYTQAVSPDPSNHIRHQTKEILSLWFARRDIPGLITSSTHFSSRRFTWFLRFDCVCVGKTLVKLSCEKSCRHVVHIHGAAQKNILTLGFLLCHSCQCGKVYI